MSKLCDHPAQNFCWLKAGVKNFLFVLLGIPAIHIAPTQVDQHIRMLYFTRPGSFIPAVPGEVSDISIRPRGLSAQHKYLSGLVLIVSAQHPAQISGPTSEN